MPTIGSVVKTARIIKEDIPIIEKVMEEEELTFSGWVHKMANEVPPEDNEINQVLRYAEMSMTELYKWVYDMVIDGKIKITDDGLEITGS